MPFITSRVIALVVFAVVIFGLYWFLKQAPPSSTNSKNEQALVVDATDKDEKDEEEPLLDDNMEHFKAKGKTQTPKPDIPKTQTVPNDDVDGDEDEQGIPVPL